MSDDAAGATALDGPSVPAPRSAEVLFPRGWRDRSLVFVLFELGADAFSSRRCIVAVISPSALVASLAPYNCSLAWSCVTGYSRTWLHRLHCAVLLTQCNWWHTESHVALVQSAMRATPWQHPPTLATYHLQVCNVLLALNLSSSPGSLRGAVLHSSDAVLSAHGMFSPFSTSCCTTVAQSWDFC